MRTAKDVAIDAVHEFMGQGFSREMFLLIIKDSGDVGKNAQKLVGVIEQAIEKDRVAMRKALGPS